MARPEREGSADKVSRPKTGKASPICASQAEVLVGLAPESRRGSWDGTAIWGIRTPSVVSHKWLVFRREGFS